MEHFGIVSAFLHSNIINQIIFVSLLLTSIYTWAVIFAKLSWFKLANKDLVDLNKMENLNNSTTLRIFMAAKPNNIYVNVLQDVLNNTNFSTKLNQISSKHYIKLDFLASVSSIAPFVGLLGTVIGVISSFNAIGVSKSASLAVIAPGIAEALYATAIGLFVAIPSLWFYNYFTTKANNIENNELETITNLFNLINQGFNKELEEPTKEIGLLDKLLTQKPTKIKKSKTDQEKDADKN